MRVRLKPGFQPFQAKPRRYAPEQRRFLDKHVDTLKEMDFFQDMPLAEWQAAPLMVPKPSSKAKYRMAVDLRPLNAATIKEAWPMPHIQSEINDFRGSKAFSLLDFVSAYWQMPLDPDSYSSCGVVTTKRVVASKRVLPGLANATSYFQSTVEPLFAELRDKMKAWLDDFNLRAASETELLIHLETFFQICLEKGLLLSAKKCTLFTKQLKWCGRIINEHSYEMDPSNLEALRKLHSPKTADELSQFVHCCRWMSQSIPVFEKRAAPLVEVLERAHEQSGKRTSRSIRKFKVCDLGWGVEQDRAFQDLQNSLQQAVKLSHPNPDKVICVFTDASDLFWSGVVTQTSKAELEKRLAQQKHEPLAFLESSFKKGQINWTTFEKEAFAIFQTFQKLDYMFAGRPDTRIFTDLRNLLFVFAPLSLDPTLGRHVVSKVQRWAFYLSRYEYVIEHVKGDENVFADILPRWTKGHRAHDKISVCSMILEEAEQIVPSAESFPWPSLDKLRSAQEISEENRKS